MRLLVVTQKMDLDDGVLGFMHGWIIEFAHQCDVVTVVCLEKGRTDLLNNTKVFSLGKEGHPGRLKYLYNFYRYIWGERHNYDAVFVHMNPEYVLLGGILWRLMGKKIGLWYAHGYVPWHLKIAEKVVDVIFTSTKSGCRIISEKIKIVGQGIDTKKFRIKKEELKIKNEALTMRGGVFKVITVGRISPVKDYETLIQAARILRDQGLKFSMEIIGNVGLAEQNEYFDKLNLLVAQYNLVSNIRFLGPLPNSSIIQYLQNSDLFVNTSLTGSLDKAILEAMSVGIPILTCNEALLDVLGDYTGTLMYNKKDPVQLASKIGNIASMPPQDRKLLGSELRNIVSRDHGLPKFVSRILSYY